MISTDNKIVSRIAGRARPQGEGTRAGGADTGPRRGGWGGSPGCSLGTWEPGKRLWEVIVLLLSALTAPTRTPVSGASGHPGPVCYRGKNRKNSFIVKCE